MIALLVVLCYITSYTDFKSGKVFNKHISIFLLAGFMTNIMYYSLSIKQAGFTCISRYALNVLICGGTSFLLYYMKTWGAGDAKLYFTLVSLVPFNLYVDDSFSIFPAFVLLVIIFGIGFVYLFVETVILFIRDIKRKHVKQDFLTVKGFSKKIFAEVIWSLLFSYLFSSTFFMLLTHYSPEVFGNNRGLFMFMNIIIITIILNGFKGKRICYAVITLLTIFVLINIFIVQIRHIISSATLISIAIFFFVIILRYIGSKYNYKELPAKDVEEGMILSYETIFKFKTYRIKGLPTFTTENTDFRLSPLQSEYIKKWASSKENETIKIVKNLPFAPFISVGTAIFVIVRLIIILFFKG